MRTSRQVNKKNRQNFFFSDMTNIKDIDLSLLNVYQIYFKDDDFIIYDVKCIKDLNSLDSLYLVFKNLEAYVERNRSLEWN